MTSTLPIIIRTHLVQGEYYLLRTPRGDTFQDLIAFATSYDYRRDGKLDTMLQDNDIDRIAVSTGKIIYVYRQATDDVLKYNTSEGVGYIFIYLNLSDQYFLIVEERHGEILTKFSIYDSIVTKMSERY
jgi:outer membrane lipoprotein-sorting protein